MQIKSVEDAGTYTRAANKNDEDIIKTQQHVRKGADSDGAGLSTAGRHTRHPMPDAGLYHVAGILVHAALDREHEVRTVIQELPGAIVHTHVDGKLVATLEGPVSSDIAHALNFIQSMPGVISAVLVSEHSEPLEALDEEISHDR